MTHLDQLESQSVYILREAFNRIDKLAMLWSLGKDSNVMVWLAKKAFFGRVPSPVIHIDTHRKFPEMYAFRDRYAVEWGLNFIREECPPVEATDSIAAAMFSPTTSCTPHAAPVASVPRCVASGASAARAASASSVIEPPAKNAGSR